jgi:hypothetical protein
MLNLMLKYSRSCVAVLFLMAVCSTAWNWKLALAIDVPLLLAAVLALCYVITRRALGSSPERAFAMTNQVFTGTPTSRRFVAMPSAANILAGQPLLVGKEPFFSLDNYQSNVGGATGLFNGSFTTTVIGQTAESPVTTHQINPGDALYATGTPDSTTNVTYGLTIDANSGNTPFGHLDPTSPVVPAGVTLASAIVQL